MAPPPNDAFANSIELTGDSGTESGTLVDATEEAGEPNIGDTGRTFQTAWYHYTPANSGVYKWTFEIDSVTYPNALISVFFYTGSVLNSLTLVSSNFLVGDAVGDIDIDESLGRLVSGTTYRIQVKTYYEDSGGSPNDKVSTFDISWDLIPPPANDDMADAIELVGTSGEESYSNIGATLESGEPFDNFFFRGQMMSSVWFKYTPATNGLMDVRVKEDLTSLVYITGAALIVAEGTPPTLSELSYSVFPLDLEGTFYYATSDVYMEAGNTYYIGISDDSDDSGFIGAVGGDAILEWEFIEEPATPSYPLSTVDPGTKNPRLYRADAGDIVVPFTLSGDEDAIFVRAFQRWQWSTFDDIDTVNDKSQFWLSFEDSSNNIVLAFRYVCTASTATTRTYQVWDQSDVSLKHRITNVPISFQVNTSTGLVVEAGTANNLSIFYLYNDLGTDNRSADFFWHPARRTQLGVIEQIRFGQFGSGTYIPLHWKEISVYDTSEGDPSPTNPTNVLFRSDFDEGAPLYDDSVPDFVPDSPKSAITVWNNWRGAAEPDSSEVEEYFPIKDYADGRILGYKYDEGSSVTVTSDGLVIDAGSNIGFGGVDVWHTEDDETTYDINDLYVPDVFDVVIGFKTLDIISTWREIEGSNEVDIFAIVGSASFSFITEEGTLFLLVDDNISQASGELFPVSDNWFYRLKFSYDSLFDNGVDKIPGKSTVSISKDRGATYITLMEETDFVRPNMFRGNIQFGVYDYGTLILEGFFAPPTYFAFFKY